MIEMNNENKNGWQFKPEWVSISKRTQDFKKQGGKEFKGNKFAKQNHTKEENAKKGYVEFLYERHLDATHESLDSAFMLAEHIWRKFKEEPQRDLIYERTIDFLVNVEKSKMWLINKMRENFSRAEGLTNAEIEMDIKGLMTSANKAKKPAQNKGE